MTSIKPNRTQKAVASMMTENTGRMGLDSGDYYGRNYEKSQGISVTDFIKQPEATLKFSIFGRDGDLEKWNYEKPEFDCTINVFHFLCDRLVYDYHMQSRYTRFVNSKCGDYDSHFECVDKFVTLVSCVDSTKRGDDYNYTVNTYNGEDLLSQIIQYTSFKDAKTDEVYFAVMIHGGCDARSGYTAPKFFKARESPWYALVDNASGTISCSGKPADTEEVLPGLDVSPSYGIYHAWDCEGGSYHFVSAGDGNDYGDFDNLENATNADLSIDADGNGHCPLCGGALAFYPHGV